MFVVAVYRCRAGNKEEPLSWRGHAVKRISVRRTEVGGVVNGIADKSRREESGEREGGRDEGVSYLESKIFVVSVTGVVVYSFSLFHSLRLSLSHTRTYQDARLPPRPLIARGQVRFRAPEVKAARVAQGKGGVKYRFDSVADRRLETSSFERNAATYSIFYSPAICCSSQRLSRSIVSL